MIIFKYSLSILSAEKCSQSQLRKSVINYFIKLYEVLKNYPTFLYLLTFFAKRFKHTERKKEKKKMKYFLPAKLPFLRSSIPQPQSYNALGILASPSVPPMQMRRQGEELFYRALVKDEEGAFTRGILPRHPQPPKPYSFLLYRPA